MDFPGGTVDKNLPANTWDTSLIPGPGRFHVPRKNYKSHETGAGEDERAREHHQFNGQQSKQTPGDSEGQGSLACCSSWGCRVGHDLATEQQQRK